MNGGDKDRNNDTKQKKDNGRFSFGKYLREELEDTDRRYVEDVITEPTILNIRIIQSRCSLISTILSREKV